MRDLREAEEQRRGADQEEGGCRHGDVAGGSQGSAGRDHGVGEGRGGWSPPSTLTAAAWHHFLCVGRVLGVFCSTTATSMGSSFAIRVSLGRVEWILWFSG